jgi:hypothetical protein
MTTQDEQRRELDALLERIRLGWRELESQTLTPEERLKWRKQVLNTVLELSRFIARQ